MSRNYSNVYKLSWSCNKHNYIQWSIEKGGGGGNYPLSWLTCCKNKVDPERCSSFEVADKHDVQCHVVDLLEITDRRDVYNYAMKEE